MALLSRSLTVWSEPGDGSHYAQASFRRQQGTGSETHPYLFGIVAATPPNRGRDGSPEPVPKCPATLPGDGSHRRQERFRRQQGTGSETHPRPIPTFLESSRNDFKPGKTKGRSRHLFTHEESGIGMKFAAA